MTVSSTTTKNSYSGNGSLTVFAYGFKIFDEDNIQVILRNDATGTETVQTITTDYSVSNVGNANGGNITFVTAPASGITVVLRRASPLTQTTDYTPNDPFPAESHEDALDKLTFISQQLQEEVDRSIKLSRTNTMTSTEFTVGAADRANKILAFDADGEINVAQELGVFKGNWSSGTAFVARDIVKDTSTNNIFIANTAHTSSGSEPLTTNTDSAKWDLIVDAASATTSATNAATSASDAQKLAINAEDSQYTLSDSSTGFSALHYAAKAENYKDIAIIQASNAVGSATAADNAMDATIAARDATFDALDNFDDRYLGSMSDSQTQATVSTTGTWSTSIEYPSQMTVADATGIVVGMLVTSASGINAGTNVIAIDGTTIVVNQTFTTTATGQAVTFTGHGVLGNFDVAKDGPATDNDNNALVGGQLYYNETDAEIRLYNGSNWVAAYSNGANFLPLVGGTVTGAVTIGNITIDTNTISTTDTNGDLLLTPNGDGDIIAETDNFTIRNTSDGGLGPKFILDHTTASPATSDYNAIFSVFTTDAGGTGFWATQLLYQTPDVTAGAATASLAFTVKEDGSGSPQTYVTFDGDAEQVTFEKPIVNSSLITANDGLEVNGKLDIEEVHEKVDVITSTTGTLTFDTSAQGVVFGTANQTANRTINFSNVNSTLAIGQSVTCAVLLTQGSTAYYLNAYQVDGGSITPKWQGGSAPTAGNASGIDAYSFTIIKTANATFTVLASQTQFA